jgi:diguanylate cyclase (GGDEF)-like protein/PAS domain S-box-containing protein
MSRVLIITSDDADASVLIRALHNASDGPFDIELTSRLDTAIERLSQGGIDAILVNLNLPDSTGIATFNRLYGHAGFVPIITLAGNDDEPLAREAVQCGSQGYLSQGYYESYLAPQSLRNVIERKGVEESLYKERAQAEITLNCIGDAVISTDSIGIITFFNIAAETMTGWSRENAKGRVIADVLKIVDSETRMPLFPHPVESVLRTQDIVGFANYTVLIRTDGAEIAIEHSIAPLKGCNGEVTGAVIMFHDVTVTRELIARMAHLGHHDFLTGLPNRVLLKDRIQNSLTLAQRHATQIAILFLDIDNFKQTNDSLGHEVGDKLLQQIAGELTSCVRSGDTISRMGGDEFVILLSDDVTPMIVSSIAEKIRYILALPHVLMGHDIYITVSIGVSMYPSDGRDVGVLLKNADTAMYSAKEKGRDNCQFFDNEMNARAVERQLIESSLRRALIRHEFLLYYQPKVNLVTGKITGAEALLRWVHPEWGLVLPGRFISIAEECGLIIQIGRWVLREACLQAKRWIDMGINAIPIAVNISALEFRHKDFLPGLRTILAESALPPEYLQLEITESVLMHDSVASAGTMAQLSGMGVLLAVDDFGTGYSSLSYLKQFPINVLKIDQSFVRDITASKTDSVIVSAIIDMGNQLKQVVVAEGIENSQQLTFLKLLHCCEGQGYLFSPPVTPEDFTAMLYSYSASSFRESNQDYLPDSPFDFTVALAEPARPL